MKQIAFRLTIFGMVFLTTGCGSSPQPTPPPADLGPPFCLVEEKRKFSQEEWAWRVENAAWNIRRDRNTNLNWEAFDCDGKLAAVAE